MTRAWTAMAVSLAMLGAACSPPAEPPQAPPGGPTEAPAAGADLGALLSACDEAAKTAAASDPTTFACDWAAIGAAKGASDNLSGRYAPQIPGVTGVLTVLDPVDGGAPRAALSIASEPSLHTCTFNLEDGAREGAVLRVTSMKQAGCWVRISPAADGVIVSSEGDCTYYCGARAGFTGTYLPAAP